MRGIHFAKRRKDRDLLQDTFECLLKVIPFVPLIMSELTPLRKGVEVFVPIIPGIFFYPVAFQCSSAVLELSLHDEGTCRFHGTACSNARAAADPRLIHHSV